MGTGKFAVFLEQLLTNNDKLAIIAKASSILMDHEHIFREARINTDIRPIFSNDSEESPQLMVLVHTLKIGYHEGGEHKEFFVALDTADLLEFQSVLVRAESKTRALEKFFEDRELTYLDMDQEV